MTQECRTDRLEVGGCEDNIFLLTGTAINEDKNLLGHDSTDDVGDNFIDSDESDSSESEGDSSWYDSSDGEDDSEITTQIPLERTFASSGLRDDPKCTSDADTKLEPKGDNVNFGTYLLIYFILCCLGLLDFSTKKMFLYYSTPRCEETSLCYFL